MRVADIIQIEQKLKGLAAPGNLYANSNARETTDAAR
jgi:hypothetical protein